MEEGPKPGTELLLQPADVLPARPVALAGNDCHDLVLRRIVRLRNRSDGLAKDRIGLRVRRDQDRVDNGARIRDPGRRLERSEEHTSELQSRENLVCRLLLEKKKQI